jgi:hypothetical protein
LTAPSSATFAAYARRHLQELHTEWDSAAEFATLHTNGGQITVGTLAMLDPAINPSQYPAIMTQTAYRALAEEPDPEQLKTSCGYLLFFEAFSVRGPGPETTEDERRRYDRERREHRIHERADAVEQAMTLVANLNGDLWVATKRRDSPHEIEEQHVPADGDIAPGYSGHHLVRALLGIALAARMFLDEETTDRATPAPER